MGILDKLATLVADKVNINNDEVMSLTQENEQLRRDYDAKAYTVIELEKKVAKKHDDWINANKAIVEASKENNRLRDRYDEVKTKLEDLAESGERQVSLIADYAEQIDELKNDLKGKNIPESYKIGIKNHKETIKILQTDLNKTSDIASNNKIYREAYEYISDESNKNKLKSVFSHNLTTWLSETQQSDAAASKSLKINRNAVRELKIGKRGLTVETIQKFDEVLCNYFECTVYELVTVKQGV